MKKLKTTLQFEFDTDLENLEFNLTFDSNLKDNIKDKTIKIEKRKKIKINDGSTRLF